MRLTLVLAAAMLLAGCSSSKDTSKVTEEGVDVQKNPLGALGALSRAGADMEKFQKEIENMPAVEPVHFSKLIAALPEPPAGWTATPARGETNQMGDFKLSRASRTYQKEGGEGRVELSIEDWAFNQAIYAPFMLQAHFSQETSEGYNKGIKIGEDPGREEYNTEAKRGSRSVLLHKRYHVKIEVDSLEPSAFDEWWSKVAGAGLPVK